MLNSKIKWLAAGAALGLLVACGGGAAALSASDNARLMAVEAIAALVPGVQSQVATLRTELNAAQARIIALQGRRGGPQVLTPGAANVRALHTRMAEAAAKPGATAALVNAAENGCTGLGTFLGRPDTSNPISSNLISGESCTGFLFVISDALNSSERGLLRSIPQTSFFYETPNCTGTRYVSRNFNMDVLSADVFIKGVVWAETVLSTGEITGYYMLNPASPRSAPLVTSVMTSPGVCAPFPVPEPVPDSLPVLPNDEMVTGIPSSPVPGPITVSAAVPPAP